MVNLAGHSGQSLPTCTDHWYVRGCQTNMSSNIYLAHHRRHLEFLLFVTNCLWQKYKNTNRNGQPGRPVPSHMHWPHLPSFPGCFHVSSSSSNNVQIFIRPQTNTYTLHTNILISHTDQIFQVSQAASTFPPHPQIMNKYENVKNTNTKQNTKHKYIDQPHWSHLPSFLGFCHVSSSSSNNLQICEYQTIWILMKPHTTRIIYFPLCQKVFDDE